MQTEKMTIHRALSELKVIDKRIQKAVENFKPVSLMQNGKLINNPVAVEGFNLKAQADYQSINDLFERKRRIKSAVVKANSETIVRVGGKEMSIADAIYYRVINQMQKDLSAIFNQAYTKATRTATERNEEVKRVGLKNAQIMLGKDGDTKIKPTDKDVAEIMNPYIERNQFSIVDPLNIDGEAERIYDEALLFDSEIDAVLSEANATTVIEI